MAMRSRSFHSLGPAGFQLVAYTEWADPGNPRVLVCVHGLSRNGRDFDELAEALSDTYRVVCPDVDGRGERSEEHTTELQSLMRIAYAVLCLKKKNTRDKIRHSEYKQL